MSFSKLHEGFDYLTVSVDCEVNPWCLSRLDMAKKEAQLRVNKLMVVTELLAGQQIEVMSTGSSGGYAYQFKTQLGMFSVKNTTDRNHAVKVTVASEGFVKFGGYDEVVDAIKGTLSLFCKKVHGFSVSRVDYCKDFLLPGHAWNPYKFTAKHFAGIKVFQEFENIKDDDQQGEMGVFLSSQGVTGLTFGTISNRQLTIYEKTKEAKRSQKTHWFDIYRQHMPSFDESEMKVWRVEARAGKECLKKFMKVRGFEELREKLASILYKTFELIDYKAHTREEVTDSNYARAKSDPVWDYIREEFQALNEIERSAGEIEQIKKIIDREAFVALEKQVIGTVTTTAYQAGARTAEQISAYSNRISKIIYDMPASAIKSRMKELDKSYVQKEEILITVPDFSGEVVPLQAVA